MMTALSGIRVLDLTRHIPGPYATMLLGALGADVIKVEEPPVGDPTRLVPPVLGEESVVYAALNRNKRSIVVDLRSEEGAAVVRRLAERADVLVEGFRPGVLARRGLGPEPLLAANPRLIYCSLTGYGPEGPRASRAGHDINYVALGGFLGGNRDEYGRPVVPPTQVADVTGGLCATIGILAALQARERTGRGQVVDVSLLGATLALMNVPLTRLAAEGVLGDELIGGQPCYGVYRCRDGRHLSVGALEPKFWETLVRAVGRPELAGRQWDPNPREVREILARTFASRDRDDWVQTLSQLDACVEPVLAPSEVLTEPGVASGLSNERLGSELFLTVAPPLRLANTPLETTRPAPGLGEHTDEVLVEAGFTPSDVDRMRSGGVLA